MALERCDTPEWNADEEQIADLVDFLAAHGEALEEVFGKDLEMNSGTVPQWMEESADWSQLREQIANNVAAKRHGKRKIGEVNSESSISSSTRLRRCTTLKQPLQMPKPDDAPPCRGVRRPPHTVRIDGVCEGGGSRIKPPLERRSEGFGLPGEPVKQRYLSDEIKGAPFFYFENVASMPNEDWNRIKLHLFDIEPEYVDSLHFSACRRPRGYIHNLPIEGRKKILPDPPMTIQELMPQTKNFWPAWDPRTKLNCINTRKGSEFLSKKLQLDLRSCLETADPSPAMQQEILKWCREWNLVWTAPNIPTPIAENEMEAMLGFDKDHTRNCYSTRARYKALGNSFSVFTVAFHFSVLKPLYPRGMKILSLFSGIGGAEIALHKIGVKLQVVVSVEIIEGSRRCLEAWWAATKQTGTLDQNHHDVTALGRDELVDLVKRYKGFDLIAGGSPCNNLSGNNQKTRCGIEGPQSNIFFEFSRIVGTVRELMQGLQFSSP
ncbi:hypothetical protein CY35_17G070500 [Sphagnum magellanicum]|nr:hypothetical protein CY35_17G070500 [Sphagnum magellanicum]